MYRNFNICLSTKVLQVTGQTERIKVRNLPIQPLGKTTKIVVFNSFLDKSKALILLVLKKYLPASTPSTPQSDDG